MYNKKTVSVIFATYREKNSIRNVIENFLQTGYVDEVIVVNNNAEQGTDQEIKKTQAKLFYEKRQGYGYAYQTGIKQAKGDYIILCEPDGTYTGRDLEKFLVYAKGNFDVIFGSRTGQSTPLSGADMDIWRKWANVLEAKSIEILFNTNSLTDVGCTYKLFKRDALKKISKHWKTNNSLFATELLLLTVSRGFKFIEIPIDFKKRVGQSTLTGKWHRLVKWGVHIQLYIVLFWSEWIFYKYLRVTN